MNNYNTINRRNALKLLCSGTALVLTPSALHAAIKVANTPNNFLADDDHVKDYLQKIKHFDETSNEDYFLSNKKKRILKSATKRLRRVQNQIGYANFAIIGIDQAIRIARVYTSVGRFTKEELDLMEMIFYKNSSVYGFLGSKPISLFTDQINKKDVIKIRGTGQFLYKGESLEKYNIIRNTIGREVVLTSGLRGVAKQFYLFFNKALKVDGNLSKASRSLAPPGYSLHSTGDFDVGQRRFGVANFSIQFTQTPVYHQLIKSGFCNLRYTKDNMLGVRFEPWHIKV